MHIKSNSAFLLTIYLVMGIGAFLIVTAIVGSGVSSNNIAENKPVKTEKIDLNSDKKAASRQFDYQPEQPVNGTLQGVVEIGATGFNSFVILVDSQERWEIVAKDFGTSLVYEGLATTEDLEQGIKKYLSKMFDDAVKRENIHIVISSGAQKNPLIDTIAIDLVKKGYTIDMVTPDLEAKFGFFATVPKSFRENSFFLDIGSGNTKIAWQVNGKIFTRETAGSKYYEKSIPDSIVYKEVFEQVISIPEKNRAFCFVLGGVPFQMAEQTRSLQERYTVLSTADKYEASNQRMASGLNIYNAISDATRCKFFVFDWDANFSIGYLLITK